MWNQVGKPVDGSPVPVWADAQCGLVTRAQCRGAGMTDEEVRWRLASGRWTRRHRGVYQTLPGKDGWDVTATAAFLRLDRSADGAGAALGGAAAGYVLGLVVAPPTQVEIVVPRHRRVSAPGGATLRRLSRFDDLVDDRLYPWRLGPTTAALEVAAAGDADSALSVVARGIQKRLVSARSLTSELAVRRRHPHGPLLREVLADVDDGAHSAAEVRYVRDVERAHGLPGAARQLPGRAGPGRVHDTVYEEFGVVVEVDGRLGHERWENRVRDGRRDRLAAGEGRFTTRVFWTDVAVTPCRTAAELAAVLRARGWAGQPRRCARGGCVVGPVEGSRGAGPVNPPPGR